MTLIVLREVYGGRVGALDALTGPIQFHAHYWHLRAQGAYQYLDGHFVAEFSYRQRLYLRLDAQLIPVEDGMSARLEDDGPQRVLTIFRQGEPIVVLRYTPNTYEQTWADWDWEREADLRDIGPQIVNVVNDAEIRQRAYAREPLPEHQAMAERWARIEFE
jgi:hypothetical protein